MFLQACVHRGVSASVHATPQSRHPPGADTPTPGSRHPPRADTPLEQTHTPGADTPKEQTPTWEQTPPLREQTPPGSRHPWETATAADGAHPTGMHSCLSDVITACKRSLGQGNIFTSTCQEFCSQGGGVCSGCGGVRGSGPGGCGDPPPDGYCCGRYASYWNALLIVIFLVKISTFTKMIYFLLVVSNINSLLSIWEKI